MNTPATTRLCGIGTALPEHKGSQASLARFMSSVVQESYDGSRRDRALDLIERIYPRSGIEERYSVLADFGRSSPEDFTFFPRSWDLEPFPSTAKRMSIYESESVVLGERAARAALADSGVESSEVTHIVVCTCTGFFAPGLDVVLSQRLGLPSTTARTIVGFMGCYAGFSGLRIADQIVRAEPQAVVLQVCVELCSLHFQKKPLPDLLVANCVFADGCAAVVYRASESHACASGPRVVATQSVVEADSLGAMSWRIGDTGFEMRLSAEVPRRLRQASGPFVEALLARAGLRLEDVGAWAIHPGGTGILDAVAGALRLSDDALEASRKTLARFGNLSSASVFFVIEALRCAGNIDQPVVALGFGPGLTLEGAVFSP